MKKPLSNNPPHAPHPRKLPRSRSFSNASSEGNSPASGKTMVALARNMIDTGVYQEVMQRGELCKEEGKQVDGLGWAHKYCDVDT